MNKDIKTGFWGLRLSGLQTVAEASEAMRQVFVVLRKNGMLHHQILFPYCDDLLLTGRITGMFGAHAVLWGVEEELWCARGMDCDWVSLSGPADTAAFLNQNHLQIPPGAAAVGDLSTLFSGPFIPWKIRGHARNLCSLAEHLARMAVKPLGFNGGALIIQNAADLPRAKELYCAKTGSAVT